MKIIRAEHLGMCFGVRDALALARRHSQVSPLTILGDLVHNETVLRELESRGVRTESDPARIRTATVMITAHGASQKRLDEVRHRGFAVTEATCPLVKAAHRAAAQLVAEGFHPVIVGQREHVEVRGVTEDLNAFDVVLTEAEVAALTPRPRFGALAQTTQPVERVRRLVRCLRNRFPEAEVRFIDTVCRPTKERQHAAADLAQHSDAVVVIGGARSNNTRELVESCRSHCARVFHVQTATDLQEEWFRPADTVGITAGTSTPDHVIDAVEARLQSWAAVVRCAHAHIEQHA